MTILINFILSAIVFLIVLGILIVIHELGHYTAGRVLNFSIESFSIGFGPKIAEFKGKHNLWQLRWLLFGGFVKFKGELQEDEGKDEPGYFLNKKRWERFLVMIMGVAFNVIFAYFIFSFICLIGIEESIIRNKPPVVGAVLPDSPSYKAGIQRGDILLSFDGRKIKNWEEAREEISSLMQKDYKIQVLRDGKIMEFTISPVMVEVLKQPSGEIGVIPSFPPIVGGVQKDSPADKAQIKPGDQIVAINGKEINYWDEISLLLKDNGEKEVTIRVKRDNNFLDLKVTPQLDKEQNRYLIGIQVKDSEFQRYTFPKNFVKAGGMVVDQTLMTKRILEKLVQRKIPLKALSAPPSIAYITYKVARTGLYNLLFFMGIISFQLGFFNLLPIPGLDGGQILVLLIEAIIRRDLPEMVKEWILKIGFAFLLLFFFLILFIDIFKYV